MPEIRHLEPGSDPLIESTDLRIPDDADFGTGTFTTILKPNAIAPDSAICPGVVNVPRFRIHVTIMKGASVSAVVGRADCPLSPWGMNFTLPSNLDPSVVHTIEVRFASWKVLGANLDGEPLQELVVRRGAPRRMKLDESEEHFTALRKAQSDAEADSLYDTLFSAYVPLVAECFNVGELWRIVPDVKTRGEFVEDIGPPPIEKARVNRLNDEKTPVFYGASNWNTAFVEVGAPVGTLIRMGAFRSTPGQSVRLGLIGELHNSERNGTARFPMSFDIGLMRAHLQRLGGRRAEELQFIDAFFSNVLCDPDAGCNGYFLTRALWRAFLRKEPSVEGLVYPTVRNVPGFNVFLTAEAFRKLRPVICTYAKVERIREFGFSSVTNIELVNRCDAAGRFSWQTATADNRYLRFNLTEDERGQHKFWNDIRAPNE